MKITNEIKNALNSGLKFNPNHDKENKEIEIIKEFLPQQLSHEEVEKVCSEIISSSGAASLKDMGKVMQILKEKYLGKIDFSFAGKILKEKLKG